MRFRPRILLPILGGFVFVAIACNVQPSDPGGTPTAPTAPTLAPEPGTPVAARPTARPPVAPRFAPRPVVASRPTGPRATRATPLPPADQRIAIFHSANLEGELDPCG